jgi:chaperonin GroES
MSRKDLLAAGQRSAKFAGGFGEGEGTGLVMSDEDRAALDAQTAQIVVEKKDQPRQKFYPLDNVLLVRRVEAAKESEVLITDPMEKDKPAEGFILERGPNVSDALILGTHVVFGKYSGTEFKLNGETLLLMKTEEVLGTLGLEQPPYEYDNGQTWLYNGSTGNWDIPVAHGGTL